MVCEHRTAKRIGPRVIRLLRFRGIFFVDRFRFRMIQRGRMATAPQVDISKQMLDQVVTQLSFALAAAKDVPSEVVLTGSKFLAELKKWAESK